MPQNLNIAILSTTGLETRIKLSDCKLYEFSIDEEISSKFNDIDAFVLDLAGDSNVGDIVKLIRDIRANPDTYLKPVFCSQQEISDYSMEYLVNLEQISEFIDMVNNECRTNH